MENLHCDSLYANQKKYNLRIEQMQIYWTLKCNTKHQLLNFVAQQEWQMKQIFKRGFNNQLLHKKLNRGLVTFIDNRQ